MTKRKNLLLLPSVWCSHGMHQVSPEEVLRIKSASGKRTRVICKSCRRKQIESIQVQRSRIHQSDSSKETV